jgi:UvrD-like helicase family protein
MQLRMVRRRSRAGSMTILGDLLQATTPAGSSSWAAILEQLGAGSGTVVHELPRAYRSNSQILNLSNRLLPEMGVDIGRPVPARRSRSRPVVQRVAPADLVAGVVENAVSLARRWRSIGLVASDRRLDELDPHLRQAGLAVGDARQGDMARTVTLIPPELTKGLEFDAVVLVDPRSFADLEDPAGLRLLYVTMTRANQRLAIIHTAGLPPSLGLGDLGLPFVEGSTAPKQAAGARPDGPSASNGHAVLVRKDRSAVSATCLCGWRYRASDPPDSVRQRGRVHVQNPRPGRPIEHPVALVPNGRRWSAGCRCGWMYTRDRYERVWAAAAAHQRLRLRPAGSAALRRPSVG